MTIQSINPATGETIKQYLEMSSREISGIIKKSQDTFQDWRETTFTHRADILRNVSQCLRINVNDLSHLIASEMGKVLKEGRAEIEKCAWVCDYYAENAENFLKPEYIDTDANISYVCHQPLGVVLAVMPWNFPFWQVFRFAAPALMAGNVCLLKHSSNVPGCAIEIEKIFKSADLPDYAFKTLLIGSSKVDEIIENPAIKAVTLTGSTPAGKAVAAKAGSVLKKTVLELGGSDPYIILEDAEVSAAVKDCVTSKLINAGQSCIAAKRFIVVEKLLPEFERLFIELMREKKMGDPMDENVQVGPLARVDLRAELHGQVEKSVEMGARCLLGGFIADGKGAFYPPTVLSNVVKGMPAYDEEMFGPVAAIISVADEQEAVAVANDTCFGLGAAIFTRDIERAQRLAESAIETGSVFVNSFVKSDPRLPFGGVKDSGYGRELSHQGIKEFTNIKTISIGKK